MTFEQLLEQVRRTPESFVVPASWAQGRASYGGLVAALVYEAMQAKVPSDRFVRSLAITFVGPLQPEKPASFEAKVLREGRAVSQILGQAVQDGEVVAIVQGSFGASRESMVAVSSTPAPAMRAWQECPLRPFVSGVMPEFVRYLEIRGAEGGSPFSNNKSRSLGGWMRFADPLAEPVGVSHLLGLVDAWPPAVLPHLDRFARSSSLTWTIEFVQPLPELLQTQWCQYRAEIEHARDGYGHIAAGVWTEQGELMAISRQTVTVFG